MNLHAAMPWVAQIPEEPRLAETLIGELGALIASALHPESPTYLAHMDSIPTLFSIVGAWVSAALNENLLASGLSPALSALEDDMVRPCGQFSFGPEAGGTFTSGGSLANLQALAAARNDRHGGLEDGVWGRGRRRRPVVLASEDAHVSITNAAMMLGLGTSAVIPVRVDGFGRVDPQAAIEAVRTARLRGGEPFSLVATAGTTVAGNHRSAPGSGRRLPRRGPLVPYRRGVRGRWPFQPAIASGLRASTAPTPSPLIRKNGYMWKRHPRSCSFPTAKYSIAPFEFQPLTWSAPPPRIGESGGAQGRGRERAKC